MEHHMFIAEDLYWINVNLNGYRPNEPAKVTGMKNCYVPGDTSPYQGTMLFECTYDDGKVDYNNMQVILDGDAVILTMRQIMDIADIDFKKFVLNHKRNPFKPV